MKTDVFYLQEDRRGSSLNLNHDVQHSLALRSNACFWRPKPQNLSPKALCGVCIYRACISLVSLLGFGGRWCCKLGSSREKTSR